MMRLLFLPPVAIGVAVLAFALAGREGPRQAEPAEVARPVRVIEVVPADFVPRALGYGHVEPGTVWEAVAEVSGKIVERHPDLERGQVMPAEKVLLRIDPTDYELALARVESDRQSVEAQLAELAVRESNTRSSLEIERRAQDLESEDLERQRALLKRGNASQAAVDQAETALLSQRQRVQELENELKRIPAERRVLEANLAVIDVQLREARRDLERTTIRLPFDARIAEVKVEAAQFVSVGEEMIVADSIDVAEVVAQVPIDHLRRLIPPDADLTSLSADELSQLPRRFGLSAEVRLKSGGFEARWEGRLDRGSDTVDPETRTVGMIVAVDEPYRKVLPGKRPPLTKNMYVEVELRASVQPGRIVVPRVATHRGADGDGLVYLVDGENRLEQRSVTLGAVQGDFVVVETGLHGGERLLVSDVIPAIEGMLLAPTRDETLETRLIAQASGAETLR